MQIAAGSVSFGRYCCRLMLKSIKSILVNQHILIVHERGREQEGERGCPYLLTPEAEETLKRGVELLAGRSKLGGPSPRSNADQTSPLRGPWETRVYHKPCM